MLCFGAVQRGEGCCSEEETTSLYLPCHLSTVSPASQLFLSHAWVKSAGCLICHRFLFSRVALLSTRRLPRQNKGINYEICSHLEMRHSLKRKTARSPLSQLWVFNVFFLPSKHPWLVLSQKVHDWLNVHLLINAKRHDLDSKGNNTRMSERSKHAFLMLPWKKCSQKDASVPPNRLNWDLSQPLLLYKFQCFI